MAVDSAYTYIERFDPPLEAATQEEMVLLWECIFATSYDFLASVLRGRETSHNRDLFYRMAQEGKTAATSHVTAPCADVTLGGLGEVATAPRFRHRGMATAVCEQARDDFFQGGGEALFLGTGNPDAARVYQRLGWRKITGSNAMVSLHEKQSPESFLVDRYRGSTSAQIHPASPAVRVPMIPLVHTPHDWKVLDATIGLHSNRYQNQPSVMGLYPKYEALLSTNGTWFELRCDRGLTVGLATAKVYEDVCRVDGFTHALCADGWADLIETACCWGSERGGGVCEAVVCVEDEEKRAAFEGLDFSVTDEGPKMNIADRLVASSILRRAVRRVRQ